MSDIVNFIFLGLDSLLFVQILWTLFWSAVKLFLNSLTHLAPLPLVLFILSNGSFHSCALRIFCWIPERTSADVWVSFSIDLGSSHLFLISQGSLFFIACYIAVLSCFILLFLLLQVEGKMWPVLINHSWPEVQELQFGFKFWLCHIPIMDYLLVCLFICLFIIFLPKSNGLCFYVEHLGHIYIYWKYW